MELVHIASLLKSLEEDVYITYILNMTNLSRV